jgi:hypothetical protein
MKEIEQRRENDFGAYDLSSLSEGGNLRSRKSNNLRTSFSNQASKTQQQRLN